MAQVGGALARPVDPETGGFGREFDRTACACEARDRSVEDGGAEANGNPATPCVNAAVAAWVAPHIGAPCHMVADTERSSPDAAMASAAPGAEDEDPVARLATAEGQLQGAGIGGTENAAGNPTDCPPAPPDAPAGTGIAASDMGPGAARAEIAARDTPVAPVADAPAASLQAGGQGAGNPAAAQLTVASPVAPPLWARYGLASDGATAPDQGDTGQPEAVIGELALAPGAQPRRPGTVASAGLAGDAAGQSSDDADSFSGAPDAQDQATTPELALPLSTASKENAPATLSATGGSAVATSPSAGPSQELLQALKNAAHPLPDQPVELVLSSEELGRLRLRLHQEGDTVRISVSAARTDTEALLRRSGDALAAEFRAAGFSGATLSFEGGEDAGRRPERADESPGSDPLPQAATLIAQALPPGPARAGEGLDLRL